jgi:hypothetical protein
MRLFKHGYEILPSSLYEGGGFTAFLERHFPAQNDAENYYNFCPSNFGNVSGGSGVFGKGFASMDAGIEPTWMYLRRPLTGTPVPNFDLRWV